MRLAEGIDMEFKYEVKKILKTLRENRETHKKDYDEAVIEFKRIRKDRLAEILKKIGENIAEVEASIVADDPKTDLGKIIKDVDFHLPEPKNYLEQYDDMIEQLEMTSQKELELSHRVFKQLVQDDWDWKHEFDNMKTMYLSKDR